MLRYIILNLDVELNQAIHRYSNRDRFNDQNLVSVWVNLKFLECQEHGRLTQTWANAGLSESSQ
jgi:hypothetical protein